MGGRDAFPFLQSWTAACFRGGELEAGSELPAWTETSLLHRLLAPRGLPSPAIPGYPLGCLAAGGELGPRWVAITSAIDSGLSFPVLPPAAGTKGSLRSASADNLSEDVLSSL